MDLDLDMDLGFKFDMSSFMKNCLVSIKAFTAFFGVYIMWISLHYAGAHLYTAYCVPGTIIGFLLSPFTAVLPYCEALRWLIYYGGHSIIAMWILLGFWLCKHIIPIKAI
jgi:hypothetical protein